MKKYFVLLCCLLACVLCGADFIAAKAGKAAAEIVTGKNPDVTTAFAAEELALWIKEISGAVLPVRAERSGKVPAIILDDKAAAFPADGKKLQGNDGYSVRMKNGDLYISGSKPKGVLNGVFRFLYNNTDIIWACPQEYGTIFSKNPDLKFSKTDYLDIPAFVVRGWACSWLKWNEPQVPSETWAARNNYNTDHMLYGDKFSRKLGNRSVWGYGHNLCGQIIQAPKYYDKHPEYYPLINGKRVKPGKYPYPQLCFTNPGCKKDAAKELINYIKNNPAECYTVSNEDNNDLCNCAECLKPVVLANGTVVKPDDPAFRSTQFFLWLTYLINEADKVYPGKMYRTNAYLFNRVPPKCPVPQNLEVSYAPVESNNKYPLTHPQNIKYFNEMVAWSKAAGVVRYRNYHGLVTGFPRPTDAVLLQDLRDCLKLGVNRYYSEMFSDVAGTRKMDLGWDAHNMQYHVMFQSLWDPGRELKDMRMDYLTRVYGKAAAPDMLEYYTIIEKKWDAIDRVSNYQDSADANWMLVLDSKDIISKLENALANAEKKITSAKAKQMFARVKKNFLAGVETTKTNRIVAVRTPYKPDFRPLFDVDWNPAVAAEKFMLQYYSNPMNKLHKDRTSLRMLYDDNNLYIGIRCYVADRKNMYIPARNDKKTLDGEGFRLCVAGYFVGYPKHTVIYFDCAGNHWQAGRKVPYEVKTALNDDGWSAMVTLPWKNLGINVKKVNSFYGQFIRWFERRVNGTWPGHAAYLLAGRIDALDTFIKVDLQK